ncbi:FUSC family protein [Hyphomicrobium sp. NDB2Meth4]|uniref:FUSC family protein n=1 Tax=Hyphomicrobium sp. NDB2Meth4 TaxID=1892846 RepID=UPI000931B16E|nr:FUSC family protein [Hyphomicrobium sp. NDB2Meth4]
MVALPTARDLLFALKTFSAAIIALYLAMWFDLARPYWALTTVFITSQVLAGATRSKALYRVLGTLLGAAVSVVLVPNLVNSPELLTVAIAAWVAGCLYLSLLDRTPRSYVPMLAGYTAAIVGFPTVDAPGTIFDVAVSRVEEITLGILCASAVSSIVFPQSVLPIISQRLDNWILGARAWAIEVLEGHPASLDTQSQRLRLASDAVALDSLATSLRYESSRLAKAGSALTALRQHMLMFLPIASSMSDRIGALRRANALPDAVQKLLHDAAEWLHGDVTDPDVARALSARASALEPPLAPGSRWTDMVLASLLMRLREFINLRQDTRRLQGFLRNGTPLSEPMAFEYSANVQSIRHRDHGMALLSGVGAFLAIVATCAIWIGTGWPDGSAAPMMAAIACSFFATFDDPAPYIISFANAAIVGAICSGIYLFGVLPHATTFEMLILALAPWLITVGLFMAQPRTAVFATGVAVNGTSMIAIQNGAVGEFTPFANSAIAVLVGIWTAAIVIRLVRSVGAAWSAHRLRDVNRRDLILSASHGGRSHGLELAALMLDRVGLMAPRLAALPPEDAEWTKELLAEVRSGINIVELRRVRALLPPRAEAAVESVLVDVARHFRANLEGGDAALVTTIDAAIGRVLEERQTPSVHEALMGLVGLRRGLFPEIDGFETHQTMVPA